MFWLPRKTIYKGPRLQRGNITFAVGLPPTVLTLPDGTLPDGSPGGGGAWSELGVWESSEGDIPAIVTAFNNVPRGQGIAWNPSGTLLSLASTSDDSICTFSCSTPWNPSSATLVTRRSVTNPQGLFWNGAGNVLFSRDFVGDYVEAKPGAGFVVGLGAALSNITKGDLGAGGATDGFVSFQENANYFISEQDGPVGGNTLRRANFTPPGNLDSFALGTAVASPWSIGAIGLSGLDKTEKFYYRCLGSQGLSIASFPDNPDLSTASESSPVATPSSIGTFRPDHCWYDVNDTRYFWAVWDTFGVKIIRYATNVPEL